MKRTQAITLLGVTLLSGCGESDKPPPENPPDVQRSTRCTMTVTGAVEGTAECTRGSLVHAKRSNSFKFFLDSLEGQALQFGVAALVLQPPQPGTFSGPTDSVSCGILVVQDGRRWYSEYDDRETGVSLRGSCTLTLTAIEPMNDGSVDFPSYWAWGTVRAHLLEVDGPEGESGPVDVVFDFSE